MHERLIAKLSQLDQLGVAQSGSEPGSGQLKAAQGSAKSSSGILPTTEVVNIKIHRR